MADMRMSFRSSPEILTFVDTVWNEAPVIDVPFAQDRPLTADKISHTAKRWNEPGFVELWPIVPKDAAEETDAWARPVDALRVTAPKVKLARAVAGAVKQMVSGGASVWGPSGVRRAAEPGDILILVRERRGGFFDSVINALKSAGVPVAGADRLRLADYIGVQDCLNLMRFAMLPERDLTLAEILRGPFCGLVDDDQYLFELSAGRKQGETLWSRVQASPQYLHSTKSSSPISYQTFGWPSAPPPPLQDTLWLVTIDISGGVNASRLRGISRLRSGKSQKGWLAPMRTAP
jgi:ATP-dependent helicase/nuclease subunit A